MGHFHEHGDAAAVRRVGLGVGDAAGRDHLFELVQRVKVLAGGDRQPTFAHDAGVSRHVVRDGRFLEPHQAESRERARRAERLIHAPAHVGVDHQRKIVAEALAHRADAGDIL
jgi:hypothetical protein